MQNIYYFFIFYPLKIFHNKLTKYIQLITVIIKKVNHYVKQKISNSIC